MYAIKTFSLLAIAGSALAAPWGEGKYWQHGGDDHRAVATATATATAYTTVTASSAADFGGQYFGRPTASAAPVSSEAPVATPSFSFAPQQPASNVAASSAQPTATSSSSSDSGYMGVVSEYRSKMGLGSLTQSDQLQANALKTAQDGNGQMVHELNSGSMAQVLAPGDADNFVSVFVGGWLCEMPSLPGLDGICSSMSAGWDYAGQTGHAEILSSTSYSKIGCAIANGIWACDLA